jgi:hypothetical protein
MIYKMDFVKMVDGLDLRCDLYADILQGRWGLPAWRYISMQSY